MLKWVRAESHTSHRYLIGLRSWKFEDQVDNLLRSFLRGFSGLVGHIILLGQSLPSGSAITKVSDWMNVASCDES